MIIDFIQIQQSKFESLVCTIMADPDQYVNFDSVSDFYKVEWLNLLPQGTTWAVSGLDDGADEFYIQIQHKDLSFNIDVLSVSVLLNFKNSLVRMDKSNHNVI